MLLHAVVKKGAVTRVTTGNSWSWSWGLMVHVKLLQLGSMCDVVNVTVAYDHQRVYNGPMTMPRSEWCDGKASQDSMPIILSSTFYYPSFCTRC